MSDVCGPYRTHLKDRGWSPHARHEACRTIRGDVKHILDVTGEDGQVHTFRSTNRLYPAYREACRALTGGLPGDDAPASAPMPRLLG